MNILLNKEYTKVVNSNYIKNKKSIRNEIDWIIELRKARRYPVTRAAESYVREWIGHNRLHKSELILKEKTGILEELLWMILSI